MTITETATKLVLVRYGIVPEVARFKDESLDAPERGATVVVMTDRGLQLGTLLERLKPSNSPKDESETEFAVVRTATEEDRQTAQALIEKSEASFPDWCARIAQWRLNLELIDIEWTLDGEKEILYVLCERGPDSTKLALQAAAEGLGIVEVQPVSATGLFNIPQSSCGSGGGGCGCSH